MKLFTKPTDVSLLLHFSQSEREACLLAAISDPLDPFMDTVHFILRRTWTLWLSSPVLWAGGAEYTYMSK